MSQPDVHSGAPQAAAPASKGAAATALILGLAGLVALIVFLVMPYGLPELIWVSVALGVIAIIIAIVALVKRQSKAMAIIGLIAGVISVLAGVGLFLFALMFLGALFV